MATFRICTFEHQKRADGKFPVSIRVCWKRKYSYIKTEYYITEKQRVKKTGSLKDIHIVNELNKRIAKFEDLKSRKLGSRIEIYSVKELADYFKDETNPAANENIDFIKFSRGYTEELKANGKISTASGINTTINAIVDFRNCEKIAITEITSKFLIQLEAHLRTERNIKRRDQFGRIVLTKRKGLSDVSLFGYMTNIRLLFNAAMLEYNDEDKNEIRILHYPFRKYKIKRKPENKKRNITVEQLRSIRDISEKDLKLESTVFARDMFLLSFYLVGMNFADLYEVSNLEDLRISYERKKTKGRRIDNAFISIKVEPEANKLIEKYRDKTGQRVFQFYNQYSTCNIFSSTVNKGLKRVAEHCRIEEPLSTYYARHTWATVARNKCNVSKDDIDLALNHVDQGLKMADAYIAKDWTRIDDSNKSIIAYLNLSIVS